MMKKRSSLSKECYENGKSRREDLENGKGMVQAFKPRRNQESCRRMDKLRSGVKIEGS
jgi:hypothetical protein